MGKKTSQVKRKSSQGKRKSLRSKIILSKKDYDNLLEKNKNLIEFMQHSPLKGLELNLKRDRSLPRDINLSAIY